MKNIFRALMLTASILSSVNLMNAQPVQTNFAPNSTPTLVLSSTGKVFYNTGTFPDSFQRWSSRRIQSLSQSDSIGNPRPSITVAGSGHSGSDSYTMGGVTSSLIYQADVLFTNPSTAEGIYMHFRMADTNNYYTAKYGPYYGGILVLAKNVSGVGTNILPPLYGLASSANTWYNLEVRAIGSSLKVYFNNVLKLSGTDTSIVSGLTGLTLGICCSASNSWYVDNIKIFKSYQITITNLQPGQKVELYDSTGILKTSGTVLAGKSNVSIDVSLLKFPFTGNFKVYDTSGTFLLFTSQSNSNIWGGDNYNFTPSSSSGNKTKIVFYSKRDGNTEIYTMNPDGTNQTRLTNNGTDDYSPSWSPDAKKIVFASDRDGNGEIYIMNPDATQQIRLTNNSASDGSPVISPDGTKIAFTSYRDGNGEIYVMNINGTNPINLTNHPNPNEGDPSWSPDGKKLAFASWRNGTADIYVMNADGSNVTQLTHGIWGGQTSWSPDGSKILYNYQLYVAVMNSDGSNQTNILTLGCCPGPSLGSWSPDGSKIVFSTDRLVGNWEIYTCNANGSNLVRLTTSDSTDIGGSWSPFLSNGNILLSVDSVTSRVGDTVKVPIRVTFPSGMNYSSSEITLGGYKGGLQFLSLDTNSTLIGAKGWSYQVNGNDSVVITASAGANEINNTGILFKVKFKVLSGGCNFIPLNIKYAVFNTGTDSVSKVSGGVSRRAAPMFGDVDKNGQIQAMDASKILKYLVGKDSLDCQSQSNADVTNNGFISGLDATGILKYVVRLITSFPADSINMGPTSAQGIIAMNSSIPIPLGSIVEIPLNLSEGKNILSFEGKLKFNPAELSWNKITWSSLLNDFNIEISIDSANGMLRFAGAGSLPDGAASKFCSIYFVTKINGSSKVTLEELRWNEENKMVNVSSTNVVTAVQQDIETILTEYSLQQNYPNPFNPSTTIRYGLPNRSSVRLVITNTLGQEVAVLTNGEKEAGYHEVEWIANVASGIYFYRIDAVSSIDLNKRFTQLRKMILLK
ncbi:MAG: cohesin domain-containing protein [Bacteroidota bacterium]